MTATQTKTLFETGNDLSEDFMKVCYRRMKTNSFDVYEMIENSNVSIKHHTRRGPSDFVGYTDNGSAQYIAGIAYDSFNVWANLQNADPSNGRPGCSKCVAEDISTFADAIAIAQEYI